MHTILIQDLGYENDINSVSKSVTPKKTFAIHYKVQAADVNFKVEKLGKKQCDISLVVLGCHHMVKFQKSKC